MMLIGRPDVTLVADVLSRWGPRSLGELVEPLVAAKRAIDERRPGVIYDPPRDRQDSTSPHSGSRHERARGLRSVRRAPIRSGPVGEQFNPPTDLNCTDPRGCGTWA